VNLANAKIRDEWLQKQGVDPKKYAEVEKSFSVVTKLQRAKQLAEAYKVDSVPQIVVNGKFLVNAESAGGQERMIPAVDSAIAIARRDKPAAAAAAPRRRPPNAERLHHRRFERHRRSAGSSLCRARRGGGPRRDGGRALEGNRGNASARCDTYTADVRDHCA
jgi:hypothetical protein